MRTLRLTVGALSFTSLLVACSEPPAPTDSGTRSDASMDGALSMDAASDGGTSEASVTSDGSGDADPCASCAFPRRCAYGACVPDLGRCASNDDCPGDSYCDTDMRCIPYGVPASRTNDTTCRRERTVDNLLPSVQCEWAAAPMGDPTRASAARARRATTSLRTARSLRSATSTETFAFRERWSQATPRSSRFTRRPRSKEGRRRFSSSRIASSISRV